MWLWSAREGCGCTEERTEMIYQDVDWIGELYLWLEIGQIGLTFPATQERLWGDLIEAHKKLGTDMSDSQNLLPMVECIKTNRAQIKCEKEFLKGVLRGFLIYKYI